MKHIVTIIGLAVTIFTSSATVHSETPAESAAAAPTSDLAMLQSTAESLMEKGDYASAVPVLQEALAQAAATNKIQQVAYKAAICFEALQQPVDARAMYDRAIQAGFQMLARQYYKKEGQAGKAAGGKPDSVQDRIEVSLYRVAALCQGTGDTAGGLTAIRRLRAIAPNSRYIPRTIPLQLAFEGRPAELADALVREEEQAASLCSQAHELFWSKQHDAALPLLERVLSDYPDTAASLRARVDKARILWARKQYQDAKDIYQTIYHQIGRVAPEADYARLAAHRVARVNTVNLVKLLQRQARSGQSIPGSQWQQIRDGCRTIMENNPDPIERAEANVMLIESLSWEGRHEEVVAEVSAFFRDYRGSRESKGRLPRELAWARMYAGDALEHLAQPAEAARHYRAVLQWNTDHPGALPSTMVEHAALGLQRVVGSAVPTP